MNKLFRLFFILFFLFFLTSCSNIFELNSDVLARQALFDLMKIQEKFYQENKRFAGKLDEIKKWEIQHLSAYCLTVENNTALNYYVRKGKTVMPNEETAKDITEKVKEQKKYFGRKRSKPW